MLVWAFVDAQVARWYLLSNPARVVRRWIQKHDSTKPVEYQGSTQLGAVSTLGVGLIEVCEVGTQGDCVDLWVFGVVAFLHGEDVQGGLPVVSG